MPFVLKTSNTFLTTLLIFIFQFIVSTATSLLLYIAYCKESSKNLPKFFTNFIVIKINECAFIAYLINWPIVVLILYQYSYPSFGLLGFF